MTHHVLSAVVTTENWRKLFFGQKFVHKPALATATLWAHLMGQLHSPCMGSDEYSRSASCSVSPEHALPRSSCPPLLPRLRPRPMGLSSVPPHSLRLPLRPPPPRPMPRPPPRPLLSPSAVERVPGPVSELLDHVSLLDRVEAALLDAITASAASDDTTLAVAKLLPAVLLPPPPVRKPSASVARVSRLMATVQICGNDIDHEVPVFGMRQATDASTILMHRGCDKHPIAAEGWGGS